MKHAWCVQLVEFALQAAAQRPSAVVTQPVANDMAFAAASTVAAAAATTLSQKSESVLSASASSPRTPLHPSTGRAVAYQSLKPVSAIEIEFTFRTHCCGSDFSGYNESINIHGKHVE